MARSKDQLKRQKILFSAKILFARKGFTATSIMDIVKESGLPVGSIYTYFKNKEELVQAIVAEGWEDILGKLKIALANNPGIQAKLKIILDKFLPELFQDVELITILLSEAIELTRIEEKVEQLSGLIYEIIREPLSRSPMAPGTAPGSMQTALMVYFLGLLNTLRIAKQTSIGITEKDILLFIRQTISMSLGISLDDRVFSTKEKESVSVDNVWPKDEKV